MKKTKRKLKSHPKAKKSIERKVEKVIREINAERKIYES